MQQQFISQEHIQKIVNGFKNYYNIFTKAKAFSAVDFKNFMEPLFEEAGYRQHTKLKQLDILLIHDAGVGDFILLSATIREIRRIYPTANIILIVRSVAENMAECCPYVNRIIVDEMRINSNDFVSIYNWCMNISMDLLKKSIDICYAFNHFSATTLLSYMCGAKERIACEYSQDPNLIFALPRAIHCQLFSDLLTTKIPQQLYGEHVVDMNLGYLDYMLHAPVSNRDIEVWYTPLEYDFANKSLKKLTGKRYALVMGGSINFKCLLPETYAQFIKMLLETGDEDDSVIILGGPDDVNRAERFKNYLRSNNFDSKILDLTNKISYRQSAAILSLCDYYIGSDTGTMHVAAAVKLPILVPSCFPADIAMDNHSIPTLFAPYKIPSVIVQPRNAMSECKDSKCPYGCQVFTKPHCITQITPETMLKAFKLLEEQVSKTDNKPMYFN